MRRLVSFGVISMAAITAVMGMDPAPGKSFQKQLEIEQSILQILEKRLPSAMNRLQEVNAIYERLCQEFFRRCDEIVDVYHQIQQVVPNVEEVVQGAGEFFRKIEQVARERQTEGINKDLLHDGNIFQQLIDALYSVPGNHFNDLIVAFIRAKNVVSKCEEARQDVRQMQVSCNAYEDGIQESKQNIDALMANQ
jgi:hypothetical protein